jgi:hypothetical protein
MAQGCYGHTGNKSHLAISPFILFLFSSFQWAGKDAPDREGKGVIALLIYQFWFFWFEYISFETGKKTWRCFLKEKSSELEKKIRKYIDLGTFTMTGILCIYMVMIYNFCFRGRLSDISLNFEYYCLKLIFIYF